MKKNSIILYCEACCRYWAVQPARDGQRCHLMSFPLTQHAPIIVDPFSKWFNIIIRFSIFPSGVSRCHASIYQNHDPPGNSLEHFFRPWLSYAYNGCKLESTIRAACTIHGQPLSEFWYPSSTSDVRIEYSREKRCDIPEIYIGKRTPHLIKCSNW